MVTGIVISPSAKISVKEFEESPLYESIRDVIDGYMEIVAVTDVKYKALNKNVVMLVDDEGACKMNPQLNYLATQLAGQEIVGTVVLMGFGIEPRTYDQGLISLTKKQVNDTIRWLEECKVAAKQDQAQVFLWEACAYGYCTSITDENDKVIDMELQMEDLQAIKLTYFRELGVKDLMKQLRSYLLVFDPQNEQEYQTLLHQREIYVLMEQTLSWLF